MKVHKVLIQVPNTSTTSDMEELKACRVCLATDVKLYDLHKNQLELTFGDLTGTPVSVRDGLPQHICSSCGTLLLKFAAFRARCRRAHFYLQEARVQLPSMTMQYMRSIDRTTFKLHYRETETLTLEILPEELEDDKSNLVDIVQCPRIKNEIDTGYMPDNYEEFISTEDSEIEVEEFKVFEEFTDIIDLSDEDVTNDCMDKYSINSESEVIRNCKSEIYDKEITEENFTNPVDNKKRKLPRQTNKNNKEDTNNCELISNCSPEIYNKEIAQENVTQPVGRKKKKKPKPTNKNNKEDTNDSQTIEKNTVKRKKKGNMYNRKTEEDYVSFSKMYNFDVAFLTKEEQIKEMESRKDLRFYKTARFQCKECFRGFMMETAYKKHIAWHDPIKGGHACEVCKVWYPTKGRRLRHELMHKKQFTCRQCGLVTKTSHLALSHFKWHEGFKYECKHCPKTFCKPSSFMNHVRENHTSIPCKICGETVSGTRELTVHESVHHAQEYKCEQCGVDFDTEHALNKHRDSAPGDGCDPHLRACSQCGETFPTEQALAAHREALHQKPFKCDQCKAAYDTDRKLGIHWSMMHKGSSLGPKRRRGVGEKGQYICEMCGKEWETGAQLKYHQRIHTGEKPYQCPMCPKSFRLKGNLMVHKNTHTGERPFKCALCPDRFKSYAQRGKHVRLVHTKERPYKCHMCEKTYVVTSDLKMHIRTVHMKMPFPPRNRRRKT